MNFGLIGVGKWGLTLATKVISLGHSVTCHSRHVLGKPPVIGVGPLVPWIEMPDKVDAVLLATPPDAAFTLTKYMISCGVPVFVTKPLLRASELLKEKIVAPVTVDYVHLQSPAWWGLCGLFDEAKKQHSVSRIEAHFYADGPVRRYPALFDFGSHAVATILDLLETESFDVTEAVRTSTAEGRELYTIRGKFDDADILILTGNDSAKAHKTGVRAVFSNKKTMCYDEDYPSAACIDLKGKRTILKHDPLGTLIEEFISDVENGKVFLDDLVISSNVEMILNNARKAAGQSP